MPKIRVLQKPTDPNARLKIHDWTPYLPVLAKVLDRLQPDTILELGSGDCSAATLGQAVWMGWGQRSEAFLRRAERNYRVRAVEDRP